MNAIFKKRLRPTKLVVLYEIPSFIINTCSTIWIPVLKYILNLSVSQKHFSNQWKPSVFAPVYKKGNNGCLRNCRSVFLVNNFSKVFEIVVYNHSFYYLINELNPFQYGFYQSKYTSTNLVSYLDYISPLLCAQCQVDAVYFHLTSAFHRVPHSLLLYKLRAYGLSDNCVTWLRNYITNRFPFFVFKVFFRHHSRCF